MQKGQKKRAKKSFLQSITEVSSKVIQKMTKMASQRAVKGSFHLLPAR
jgi:hypothetical protein